MKSEALLTVSEGGGETLAALSLQLKSQLIYASEFKSVGVSIKKKKGKEGEEEEKGLK